MRTWPHGPDDGIASWGLVLARGNGGRPVSWALACRSRFSTGFLALGQEWTRKGSRLELMYPSAWSLGPADGFPTKTWPDADVHPKSVVVKATEGLPTASNILEPRLVATGEFVRIHTSVTFSVIN